VGLAWDPSLPAVAYAQSLESGLAGAKPIEVLQNQLATRTNTPLTSSLGRLFDGVAALLGVRQTISYEGQAAIELEAMADPTETGSYPLDLSSDNLVDLTTLIAGLINDFHQGESIPALSAKFHNTLVALVVELASRAKSTYGVDRVALSGGVWQNMTLLIHSIQSLSHAGFTVLTHHHIPPNDGGISLGQAAIGLQSLSVEE
jgi:hydrogenase maturation protein HypF